MNIVNLVIGAFFALLGIAMRSGKASWIIAGYNTSTKEEKEKYDEEALCRFMGNLMFVLAAILFLIGITGFLNPANIMIITEIGWILFLSASIGAVIYANTGNRFKK